MAPCVISAKIINKSEDETLILKSKTRAKVKDAGDFLFWLLLIDALLLTESFLQFPSELRNVNLFETLTKSKFEVSVMEKEQMQLIGTKLIPLLGSTSIVILMLLNSSITTLEI